MRTFSVIDFDNTFSPKNELFPIMLRNLKKLIKKLMCYKKSFWHFLEKLTKCKKLVSETDCGKEYFHRTRALYKCRQNAKNVFQLQKKELKEDFFSPYISPKPDVLSSFFHQYLTRCKKIQNETRHPLQYIFAKCDICISLENKSSLHRDG